MQSLPEASECKGRQTEGQEFRTPNQTKSYRKICAKCGKPITQSVRNGKTTLKALGQYYHEDCFTCHDCGSLLKPKYFPYDVMETKETILLCQYDYFRRHNLLCFVCDKPLRGLYYTAFGERYDEEHFSCTICSTPCGVKKCFMFQNKLYCKYHFLKYFSKRCNGCNYPISDQYIEFPKGEEVFCWHPECYGIHKYWHVNLSADTLGLPSFPKLKYQEGASQSNPTPKELEKQMQAFNSILSRTWSVLYRFEEETASCISDMFQYLASFDQIKGINSTALFVLKIECLFKAIGSFDNLERDQSTSSDSQGPDSLQNQESNNSSESLNLKYSRFPRNLSTKIMIYLQLLRKLNTEDSKVNVSSFMPVITGLTHFLKLLTRYGLYSALEKNRAARSMNPVLKFLREVERNEVFEKDPFSYIDLSINATDNCAGCGKYIQEQCIQYHESRWHIACFRCSQCQRGIDPRDIGDAAYNKTLKRIFCPHCSVGDPASAPGFKYVTKLAQLIFLLKIALIRSKAVMETQLRTRLINSPNMKMDSSSVSMQQTYIRTLNDIKRLKSRRECIRVTHDKQQARRSVILETGERDVNKNPPTQNGSLVIHTDPPTLSENRGHDNVFTDTKTLTLDDISRIVAAEHARELRPNAFTHFKKLRESDGDTVSVVAKKSGIYYSELTKSDMALLQMISLSLLSLDRRIIPGEVDITNMIPSPIKPDKSPPSNNFWWRMKFMMNKESKKVGPMKVFGTPLESLSAKWGVDSELGVGPAKIKVPIIVDELISTLRQMDMSVEGVFRKNGNIKRLNKLTAEIDDNPSVMPDLSKENAIQLSALLKKYFRELPDPLLTSQLYAIWINAAKLEAENEKQRVISLVYCMLPTHNRNVLEALLSFLCWTASFSHIENEMGSKMDIHNLSTVITPNILYAPNGSVPSVSIGEVSNTYDDAFAQNEGENYYLAIEMVDYLITRNEDMAMVPKFLMSLLNEVKDDNTCNYDNVKDFISKKFNNHEIDFSEFEVQRNIEMKHSTSLVTQGEILNK